MQHYTAPLWLRGVGVWGGNVQTIWSAVASHVQPGAHAARLPYVRERWTTPDQDFIDVDFYPAATRLPGQPMLVLFHGLEGSSQSHYARAFALWAHAQGWDYAVPHFRGCSGELNLAPRTYHSGDFEEAGWLLARLAEQHDGPLVAVGISLGGNVLLRWAQEAGATATRTVRAVAAICAPVDLAACGHAIGEGFNRQLYMRMFLRTMKRKALSKLQQHPGLFDEAALRRARNLYEYDAVFTAPLHGFGTTDHYWAKASAKPHLRHMKDTPTLVLHARNDPLIPAWSLPTPDEVGPAVTLWQPLEGGHVGFPTGRFPGHVAMLPDLVGRWLQQHC